MVASQSMRAVGVFPNRQAAETALSTLRDSDFLMQKVSLIAKDKSTDEDKLSNPDFSDTVEWKMQAGGAKGAVAGTAFGGLGGLLIGLGMAAIPGVGPVIAGGTLGTILVTTLAGSGVGALSGEMVGALANIGIPNDRAQVYANSISQGDYVVMVEGNEEEIHRAESILRDRGIQEWGVY